MDKMNCNRYPWRDARVRAGLYDLVICLSLDDVWAELGYKSAEDARSRVSEANRRALRPVIDGVALKTHAFVTEDGWYELTVYAPAGDTTVFERWVEQTVLTSLRKTMAPKVVAEPDVITPKPVAMEQETDNALLPFDVTGSNIRFGVDENGRPYVVATDFAKLLGYQSAKDALRSVDDDEKGRQNVPTPGGVQELSVLYEEGIWELIFLSRRAEAKVIKARVKAILKEIRETGGYGEKHQDLTEIEVARRYVAALEDKQRLQAQLTEQAPKVEAYDALIDSEGNRLVREVAKLVRNEMRTLKVSSLYSFLVKEEILIRRTAPCGEAMYDVHAEFVPDHFVLKETVVPHDTKAPDVHLTPYATQRGIQLIRKRLARRAA